MVNTTTFENSITTALALEMSNDPTYNVDVVASKVKSVVMELMQRRRYSKSGMSDWEIEADLNNYYPQALNVARYDFNTIGAEGEDRHTENGVDRTFGERGKLWAGVVPIGRVIR
jgi:hypothetical protein